MEPKPKPKMEPDFDYDPDWEKAVCDQMDQMDVKDKEKKESNKNVNKRQCEISSDNWNIPVMTVTLLPNSGH